MSRADLTSLLPPGYDPGGQRARRTAPRASYHGTGSSNATA